MQPPTPSAMSPSNGSPAAHVAGMWACACACACACVCACACPTALGLVSGGDMPNSCLCAPCGDREFILRGFSISAARRDGRGNAAVMLAVPSSGKQRPWDPRHSSAAVLAAVTAAACTPSSRSCTTPSALGVVQRRYVLVKFTMWRRQVHRWRSHDA